MTVFEYSSVFIAIIVGQTANELLQRMAHIMKQDKWIRRYWMEMYFLTAYLLMNIGYFFGYFTIASNLDEITIFNFLGPLAGSSLLYFIAYFAPVPHPRENITDIEGYYSQKLPKSQILLGIFIVVNGLIQAFALDLSLLFDPAYQSVLFVGAAWAGVSLTFRPLIDRYGIRRFNLGCILLGPMILGTSLQNPMMILSSN